MTYTAADVINDVLDRLNENNANPVFWLRLELLSLLNEGFLELTLMAGQNTSDTTQSLVSAKFQGIPEGSIAILNVVYAELPVEKTSIEMLDRAYVNWDALFGLIQKWAPMGLSRWVCDRTPTSLESVTLTTLDVPPTLGENDVIDLDAEYIVALTNYVFHMARFKESGGEFEQAMTAYDQFQTVAGMRASRSFSQQWTLWARDPNANTGLGDSTVGRS